MKLIFIRVAFHPWLKIRDSVVNRTVLRLIGYRRHPFENFIDDAVFESFAGVHKLIAIRIPFDRFESLAGVLQRIWLCNRQIDHSVAVLHKFCFLFIGVRPSGAEFGAARYKLSPTFRVTPVAGVHGAAGGGLIMI